MKRKVKQVEHQHLGFHMLKVILVPGFVDFSDPFWVTESCPSHVVMYLQALDGTPGEDQG